MGVNQLTVNKGATGIGLSGAATGMQPTGDEKPSKRRRRSSESSKASQLPKIGNDEPNKSMRIRQNSDITKTVLPDSLPRLVPKTVNQYTQTMMSGEIPPPLPPKTRHRSSTTPQQLQPENLQSVNCPSPPSLPAGTTSFAVSTDISTDMYSCSMCKQRLLDERRKLAEEKSKRLNMRSILKAALQLSPSHTSKQERNDLKLRKRAFSAPTRNQICNSAK